MSKDTFRVKYEIEDGYYGTTRPQYLTLHADWLPDDFDEDDLKCFLEESVQEHFRNNITTYMADTDIDSFISWGKEMLKKRDIVC